jgi:hypothetical protein
MVSLALQVTEDNGDSILIRQSTYFLIQQRFQIIPEISALWRSSGFLQLGHLLLSAPPLLSYATMRLPA